MWACESRFIARMPKRAHSTLPYSSSASLLLLLLTGSSPCMDYFWVVVAYYSVGRCRDGLVRAYSVFLFMSVCCWEICYISSAHRVTPNLFGELQAAHTWWAVSWQQRKKHDEHHASACACDDYERRMITATTTDKRDSAEATGWAILWIKNVYVLWPVHSCFRPLSIIPMAATK